MKKDAVFIGIAISLLFSISCEQQRPKIDLPRPDSEFLKMDINGVPWEAERARIVKMTSSNTNSDRFYIWGDITDSIDDSSVRTVSEIMSLYFLEKKLGKQNLKYMTLVAVLGIENTFTDTTPVIPLFSIFHSFGDIKGTCERFGTGDIQDNSVEIVQQEEDFKYIWGKFNMMFIKKGNCPEARYPDTLRITNGEFYYELP